MKIVQEEILLGGASLGGAIAACLSEVRLAVGHVVWPEGTRKFTIRPIVDGNGVLPIKIGFMRKLKSLGWRLEERPSLAKGLGPGKIDALKALPDGRQFAAEWETGNISSSHRALNKICMGLIDGHLAGGVLILPDRELYSFLTQRIGNFKELAPYFSVYRHLKSVDGVLAVIAVSHDRTSEDVSIIPKGMDGHSLKRRGLKTK